MRLFQATLTALCCVLMAAVAGAQNPDPRLDALSNAIAQARQQQVDALAPASFAAAQSALQSATRDVEKGRDSQRISAAIAKGMAALNQANTAAAAARATLKAALATRTDALTANAPRLASEAWQKADARFRDATGALERNDLETAQKRAAEADVLLREVEMTAIRNGIVNEARGLIAQADAAKVEKSAPRTLAAAKRYLAQAEQEINRNRYERGPAVNLAAQASYEARHSMYLAKVIESTLDSKSEQAALEELILSWEQPLAQIAADVDIESRFDNGMAPVMQALKTKTGNQAREVQRLSRELEDRNEQITALNAELEKLEARLGGVSEERLALQRRVDEQDRRRANLAAIEAAFSPDEARITRQGDDIVISLLGIRFPSGRATIDAASAALMDKVRDAIARFPDASFAVEGHTDSNGSDSANLILSQDRADAVRQYLISHYQLNPEKLSSIGYGEARPAATNDTAEGRARNRRIDLIIHAR